jgi:hypothetical protein
MCEISFTRATSMAAARADLGDAEQQRLRSALRLAVVRLTENGIRSCNENGGEEALLEAISRPLCLYDRGDHIVRSPGLDDLQLAGRPLIISGTPIAAVAH